MPDIDLSNEQEVRDYFARLEYEFPTVVETMKVLNVSYQQYLTALLALNRQTSFSATSTRLEL